MSRATKGQTDMCLVRVREGGWGRVQVRSPKVESRRGEGRGGRVGAEVGGGRGEVEVDRGTDALVCRHQGGRKQLSWRCFSIS